MTPEEMFDLVHLLTQEHGRATRAEAAYGRVVQQVAVLTAERDELAAKLAAMEAERNVLREDDVATSGRCEGMVPD